MSSDAVRKFCNEFKIPDLSILMTGNFAARCMIVWEVLQVKGVSIDSQRQFLREFCRNSENKVAKFMVSLVSMDIDAEQCRDALCAVIAAEGGESREMGVALNAFCTENRISSISSWVDQASFEDIVYGIDCVFPIVDEKMHYALDGLKFEANPERFNKWFEKYEEDQNAIFSSVMALLNIELSSLDAKKAELLNSSGEDEPAKGSAAAHRSGGGGVASDAGARKRSRATH
jgi:hypothetical protein